MTVLYDKMSEGRFFLDHGVYSTSLVLSDHAHNDSRDTPENALTVIVRAGTSSSTNIDLTYEYYLRKIYLP